MVKFRYFIGVLVFVSVWGETVNAQLTSLRPEIQAYHTLGNRGSSYTTVAGGLTTDLSSSYLGPDRKLQLLFLYIPEQLIGLGGKVAGWNLHSHGIGWEVGLFDQSRFTDYVKGGMLSWRHLEWEDTHAGRQEGRTTADILHIGWTAGPKILSLLGINVATFQTPGGPLMELQVELGLRYDFN